MACFAEIGIWNVIMFCVALFAVIIAITSELFRQYWNRTTISLEFNPPEEKQGPFFGCVYWISNTPSGKGVNNAIWVRIKVKNQGKRLARSCQPFLTSIKKKNNDGKYDLVHSDMLPLHWAFRNGKRQPAIDIPGKLHAFCDVFNTISGASHFLPRTVAEPCAWEKLLKEPGEYRLKVVVGGDNIVPQKKCLYIRWTNKWNDFEIAGDEQEPFTRVLWDGPSNQN